MQISSKLLCFTYQKFYYGNIPANSSKYWEVSFEDTFCIFTRLYSLQMYLIAHPPVNNVHQILRENILWCIPDVETAYSYKTLPTSILRTSSTDCTKM